MPATNADQSYDVVVVGGGVIGLACAWRAAERGMRVCVAEREHVGCGASGVAAGMLAPVGEATWGEEPLLELALASASAWPKFAANLETAAGLPSTYERIGALHVAMDRDQVQELRRRFDLHQRLGLESEWLLPRQCRALEPGLAPSCAGGLHAVSESAVDPQALCAALIAALQGAGGELFEHAEAAGLLAAGEAAAGIRLADGRELRAPTVVIASGSWSGADWLPQKARPPVRPVKGEILTLRGADQPVVARIVAGERFYAVPRADGRLVVGATVEEHGFDTTVTAGGVHELLREAYRALPEIAEMELAEARAGLRPASPDNAPLIGPGAIDGLVLATGHFRNGVLLAPITADVVVGLIAGEAPEAGLAAFAPDRFVRERVASR
ncbi:MAG: glycine oxidase ThiO [Solirubrobacterales bacterium]